MKFTVGAAAFAGVVFLVAGVSERLHATGAPWSAVQVVAGVIVGLTATGVLFVASVVDHLRWWLS